MQKNETGNLAQQGANLILDMIKKYKEDANNNVEVREVVRELKGALQEEINSLMDGFLQSFNEDELQETLAFDYAGNIFEIMDALTQGADVDKEQLESIFAENEIDSPKELIDSFVSNKKEKDSFVEALTTRLKEGNLLNKDEFAVISAYRQTSEARRDVMRLAKRENITMGEEIIQKFLDGYSTALKAEILVRLEKYIETGWFKEDQPLKDFYNKDSVLEGNVQAAVFSLKSMMELRFKKAKIEKFVEEAVGQQHRKYVMSIEDKSTSVFALARGGEKDFCIPAVNGTKIYIGDVTTEETGRQNHASWLNGLRAAKDYTKNFGVEVDYSVNITSLFYDEGLNKRDIKGKFLAKIKNANQDFIDKFHLMQYLSVLNRDSVDFKYDTVDLLNTSKVKFIGASSEKFCNKVLAIKGDQFVKEVINVSSELLDKLVKDRNLENGKSVFFDCENETSNVDSVPIGILLNAISGIGNLVIQRPHLQEDYKALYEKIEALGEVMTYGGDLSVLLQSTAHKVMTIDYGIKKFEAKKPEKQAFYAELDRRQAECEQVYQTRKDFEKNNQNEMINLLQDFKVYVSTLNDLTVDVDKARNKKSVQIENDMKMDIILALNLLISNPEKQNCLVTIEPQVKKAFLDGEKGIRNFLYHAAEGLNCAYNKNIVYAVEHLSFAVKAMKDIAANPEDFYNSYVKKNNGLSVYRKKVPMKYKTDEELKEYIIDRVKDVKSSMTVLSNSIEKQLEKIQMDLGNKSQNKRKM